VKPNRTKPHWSRTREHKICPVRPIAIMLHGAINLDCSPCGLCAVREEDKATLTVNELPHLGDHHRPLADRRGYALDRSRAHVTHCEHAGLRGPKRRRN
jgi:hypothetical protein